MYIIDSGLVMPDIDYLYNRITSSADCGIAIADLKDAYRKVLKSQNSMKDELYGKYGIENPNSPDQITSFLQRLGSEEVRLICYSEDTQKWTSDKNAMSRLALMGYQFATDILTYRKTKTVAQSIKSLMDEQNPNDNRVRPIVSMGKTNRINYKQPAIMNIPKQILWNVIRPRKEGNYIYSVDIKNQEPSILINLLGIEKLKGALISRAGLYEGLYSEVFKIGAKASLFVLGKNADECELTLDRLSQAEDVDEEVYKPIEPLADGTYIDEKKVKQVYTYNTTCKLGDTTIFNRLPDSVTAVCYDDCGNEINVKADVEWDTDLYMDEYSKKINKIGIVTINGTIANLSVVCNKRERLEFKLSWNALTYGASAFGVNNICKNIDGDRVYKYFNTIPEFKEYKSMCGKLARQKIQNINTYFGNTLNANELYPARLKRALMDLPIQGTGSDILTLLVEHLDEEVEQRGLNDKIELYFTRHDELIIEIDKDWADDAGDNYVKEQLNDLLEHRVDDWVPFKVKITKVEQTDLLEEIQKDDNTDDE